MLDTTLLFLGLPLVVSRGNRNPYFAIGLCVGVVALFMIVKLGCQSLCLTGWLQPPLAAWLPLMIFAPLAVASERFAAAISRHFCGRRLQARPLSCDATAVIFFPPPGIH